MARLRKTKLVCTLGPSSEDIATIRQLLAAGMNIARFNFSHGTHDEHKRRADLLRAASRETGIPVALMLDTKGPEIRTTLVEGGGVIELVRDRPVTVTTEDRPCTPELIGITYKKLPAEISAGKHIYIADGMIDLEVTRVSGNDIECVVRAGGEIGGRKNVNVVGVRTSLPPITDKDRQDLFFAVAEDFDFIAASFIRGPGDIAAYRDELADYVSTIQIVAKIEDEEGLANIDEIIRVSDGVMVARGDLGVQLKTEDIPLVQKRIIAKCNQANKPVVTATQMLDSMIHNSRPTRAETTDVANAVFDGSDAVMLSGETANGRYPVKAVETLHDICVAVESSPEYKLDSRNRFFHFERSAGMSTAIARAAYTVAADIGASAILTPTLRGNTARLISVYRPEPIIIAAATSEVIQRRLLLYWGVYPLISPFAEDSEQMIQLAVRAAMQKGFLKRFEKVVVAAGVPLSSPVMMNMVKILVLGTILNKGSRGFGGVCSGRIVKAADASEAAALKLAGDEILVTRTLDEGYLPLVPSLRGLILEDISRVPWSELLAANPKLVSIGDVPNALKQFEANLLVTLDGGEKIIYEGIVDG